MGKLTVAQAVQYARAAGFSGDALRIAVAIALAESSLNTSAQHRNTDGSIDRGLYQINTRWHPEVSDACAYDPVCATQAAYRISGNGTSFTPWSTFTSGAYKQFLGQVDTTGGSPVVPIGQTGNAPVISTGGPPIFTVNIGDIASTTAPGQDPAIWWLAGWAIFLVILALINRTRIGHVFIYYSLVLILILLLVFSAPGIAKVLGNIGKPSPE